MIVMGHRGASGYRLEQAIRAGCAAAALGQARR
jgi:glycerophosphoryl diester phosphodiesterase